MTTLYGIKNCDTVKKARAWLEQRQIDFRFHDFRVDGIDDSLLNRFEACLGWEALLNRKGTTWRKLSDEQRANVDRTGAMRLMLAQPSLIKRPVLERNSKYLLGFSTDLYVHEFGS